MIERIGPVGDVVDSYLSGVRTVADFNRRGNGGVRVEDIKVSRGSVELGGSLDIELELKASRDVEIVDISFDITDELGKQMAHVSNYDDEYNIRRMAKGERKTVCCQIKNINFAPGGYISSIWLGNPYETFDKVIDCIKFRVNQNEVFIKRITPYDSASKVVLQSSWK